MYPPVLPITSPLDDEVSTNNTEEGLISSKASSQTVSSDKKDVAYCYPDKNRGKCMQAIVLTSGLLMIIWGIGSIMYTPFNFLMDQRIKMTPGLPPFEWWLKIPDQVLLKVYIFNVTNSVEFLNGTDKKIKVNEIGPLIYKEKLIHRNPVFHENGTLSYVSNKTVEFLPEMNTISLNDTIIMPNLGVLFIPVYFYNAPFFTKLALNMMMRTSGSSPFVKATIQDYLWNMSDPILDTSQRLAPHLVPTKNVGILARIYSNFEDNVTVLIGPKHGHQKFFLIDKFDGSEYLPNRGAECSDKVAGSSEGVSYPQYLTKEYVVKYWRKTLCRVGHLHYERDAERFGMNAYEYVLSPKTYYRTLPENKDCYKGNPPLPNGLADVSPCYYDTSLAASFPHYLYGDDEIKNYVEGLHPDVEKHKSFLILEPNTGIPLHGIARSQINLVMKDMKGFSEKIQRFNNISIPLVWLEYHQLGLPWYIQYLTYFTVVVLPILQIILIVSTLCVGSVLLIYFFRLSWRQSRRKYLLQNKKMKFETEMFIK